MIFRDCDNIKDRQEDIELLNEPLDFLISEINMLYEETANIKNMIQCQKTNHDAFAPFHNSLKSKDVVIVGSGPSAANHTQIRDAVYVGVNNACLMENIQFDYLFCQDFYMDEHKKKAIINYRKKECIKFFGIIPDNRMNACKRTPVAMHVRRGYKLYFDIAEAIPYYIYDLYQNHFALSIENEPLMADGIIFCALQFVLQCHPKRIFLVGCDCSKGFFYESEQEFDNTYMVDMWKLVKRNMEELYPDIKMTSMNPVGLKGLFEDLYT